MKLILKFFYKNIKRVERWGDGVGHYIGRYISGVSIILIYVIISEYKNIIINIDEDNKYIDGNRNIKIIS